MSDEQAGHGEDAVKGDETIKSGHAPDGDGSPPFPENDSALGDRSEETDAAKAASGEPGAA